MNPVIHWFRRDLRLTDNLALMAALASGAPVIPVFILDPAILHGRYSGTPRITFLLKALRALDVNLRERNSRLIIRRGIPAEVLATLVAETNARALYFNRDYSPYARRRDTAVETALQIPVRAFDDLLLTAPGTVLKNDQSPYTVFTPFSKKWLTIPKADPVVLPVHQIGRFHDMEISGDPIPTLGELGLPATIEVPEASEAAARKRLFAFTSEAIFHYASGRNRLAGDSTHGTSFLSPYFHLGLLSIREAFAAAHEALQNAEANAQSSVNNWISELAWREFYTHILYFFPQVLNRNFRDIEIEWRNAPDELQAWKDGQTGFPIVDAAMRQLRQTGWMPNRARMIVASFLTKDLLIDWHAGERHFMEWLIDGDLAANNGGWQWSASTGTDAQPYFRIFNPVEQSRRYDPDGVYIRQWIPELRNVPAAAIHTPWKINPPPKGYPLPIVDHAFARARVLGAHRKART